MKSRMALVAMAAYLSMGSECIPTAPAPASSQAPPHYQSVWIYSSWEGGRTGTPLHSEAVSPTSWSGSLCPASAIEFRNHSTADNYLEIINHCSASIDFLMCGSGSSTMSTCSTDPRATPISRLTAASIGPGARKAVAVTGVTLFLNVFYCSSSSNFAIGLSGVNDTDCLK